MQLLPGALRLDGPGPSGPSQRLMWITPDRVFYAGLLGAPSVRTMGALTAYVAVEGAIRIRLGAGEWQTTRVAVVQPCTAHQVVAEARLIEVIQLEAETIDAAAVPELLRACGAIDAPGFADHVHRCRRELCGRQADPDPTMRDFDRFFFGKPIAARAMDRRIGAVVDRIKADPCAPASAEDCAASANLSFSRFLHLFKQEAGVPFRSFRTWKRARGLLHHVNREANLAHVALDTGYPDSTHFSHSIRQVYGLKPKDIFAGSRRLAVFAHALPVSPGAGLR
jgi:AraC-like DNA-binding protein